MRSMGILCIVLLLSFAIAEGEGDDEVMRLKIALQRSREAATRCENDLADIWSQAEKLGRVSEARQKEFADMQRDYENVKKQLNERSSESDKK